MRRTSWNISVLVLFLLVVSSLIGLMTISFIKQMIVYTASITQYYQSYYLANAWLELLLTKVKYRGLGYQEQLTSGDALVSLNGFRCPANNCAIQWSIVAMNTELSAQPLQNTSCSADTAYVMKPGGSIIIPLFRDDGPSSTLRKSQQSFTNIYVNPSFQFEFVGWVPSRIGLGFGLGSGAASQLTEDDTMYLIASGTTNYDLTLNEFISQKFKFSEFDNFLVINNPLWSGSVDSDVLFCLRSQGEALPTSTVLITALGQIGDRQVGIQAIKNVWLPDFLFQTYIGQ